MRGFFIIELRGFNKLCSSLCHRRKEEWQTSINNEFYLKKSSTFVLKRETVNPKIEKSPCHTV